MYAQFGMEAPSSTTGDQNGTNSDKKDPILDQNRDDRTQYLEKMHDKGGFILACKTLVTLHRVATTADDNNGRPDWEITDYGVLTIMSKKEKLSLMIGDVNTGKVLHEFELRSLSSTQYTVQKPHFHSFVAVDGSLWGLSFVDVGVAGKVSRVLNQLMTGKGGRGRKIPDEGVPQAKHARLDSDKYSEWVIISDGDVPSMSGANEATGLAGEGGTEETDFGFFSKKKKDDFKVDDISGPSYFRHLTHTTDETGIQASLKGVEPGERSEDSESRTGTFERGTKRSSSFMEMEFQEPQITASSTASDLTGSGSIASSFTGSSLSIPEPPEHTTDEDTLLSQINTFDRKKLHHVTPEARAPAPNSLTAMFQNGFDRLLPKLQAQHQLYTMASINSEGEEEGFDEFDGQLFE